MTITHAEARALINEGYRRVFGEEPPRHVAQLVQAVGWLETCYASAWSVKIPGAADSNNWGAITAGREWDGETFEHRDSKPVSSEKLAQWQAHWAGKAKRPEGGEPDKRGNVWYSTKFRRYPSLQDGATDLVRIVYLKRDSVHKAGLAGDALAFSTAMYNTVYYTGFGRTPEERIKNHYRVLCSGISRMCKSIGEPPPDILEPDHTDEEFERLRRLTFAQSIELVRELTHEKGGDEDGNT